MQRVRYTSSHVRQRWLLLERYRRELQEIGDEEKSKNRLAIIALIRCTHFLVRHHIAHTTNFDELVDLVVSCGAEDLRRFLEKAGKNASYTSKVAVVEFVEAIGVWAEESLLKCLRQASNFSIMADECTDVTTIEELSIFFCWVEDGIPLEHFFGNYSLESHRCCNHPFCHHQLLQRQADTYQQTRWHGL